MPAAVELQGINKSFGSKVAVRDMNLVIEPGSLTGFIGPNGAGKTTTIRMIMSIIFPDSGRLSVLGRASAVESKDRIGYLPEERGLYKKMRVGAFLVYAARLKGVAERGLDSLVRQWIDRVELGDVYRKRCEELSKGMQQKVQFIASVIHQPDLVILDEPFSGLDPVNSRLLRRLIEEQHTAGHTIIFSTHQMSQAEALCDRVVMIHQGRKVLDDSPRAIKSSHDPRAITLEPVGPFDPASIRHIPEIAGVTVDNSFVRIDLRDGADAADLIPHLAQSVRVRRIEVMQPTLEDVFVNIVQGVNGGDAASLREALHSSVRSEAGGD